MISLLLFIGASLLSALTFGVVMYRDKYQSEDPSLGQLGFMRWIIDSHHWHTFGHFMLDFAMVVFIATLCLVSLPFAHELILSHPIAFSFLCMVGPTILVLFQELIYDRHLYGFLGKEPHDTFDFFFDVYTHLAGGVAAALFIAAMLTSLG